MKRIILSIFFLLAVVYGWNTMGENIVPVKSHIEAEQSETSEAKQHTDQIVSVLTAANSYADVSARTTNSLPTSVVRRYRPGGFSFDYLFICLKIGQNVSFDQTFKSFLELSQLYAAQLKDMGYYIYTLRKIII